MNKQQTVSCLAQVQVICGVSNKLSDIAKAMPYDDAKKILAVIEKLIEANKEILALTDRYILLYSVGPN